MKNSINVKGLIQLYSGGKKVCVWGAGYLAKTTCKDVFGKLGIKPFCFCDNNKELVGKTVYDEIECIDCSKLLPEKDNVVFVIAVRFSLQDEIIKQLNELGFTRTIPITEMTNDKDVVQMYLPFLNVKTVAYTCVLNNYDKMHYPDEALAEKYDFYYISDNKPNDLGSYKGWIDVREVCPNSIEDYTRINRYCKINVHKLFPDYDRSIYYDGNIVLKKDPDIMFEGMSDMGLTVLARTGHNDVYCEAAHKMSQMVDSKDLIYKQVEKYWREGLPSNSGNWLCTILLRKHNLPKCKKLMDDWWTEVSINSKRDQLSLPYVVWKNGYKPSDVTTILQQGEKVEDNEYFTFYSDHLRKK